MKKLFFTLFVMLPFMAVTSSAQILFDRGDVNGDGNADISDVVTLVSIILNGGDAHLTCPDNHHPHMIDLGLPSGTKWACCNVGANKPEDYGGYYAWGETEEKTTYNWNTYNHYDGSSSTCHNIGRDIAGTQYDVAHVKWGGSWVMPSREQINELLINCTHEWTTVNSVNGRKFTSKTNGGSIFLPAAGERGNSELSNAGGYGDYWSSTLYESYPGESDPRGAVDLYFYSGRVYWDRSCSSSRSVGHSVRPVR